MNEDQISQKLAALVAYEEMQWADKYPPPELPEGAPNLARMYTAILREDWTDDEWDLVQDDPQVKRMYSNTQEHVWYPTMQQLRQYADGRLSDELLQAIQHHLEVDKCRRSIRVLGWLKTAGHVVGGIQSAIGKLNVANEVRSTFETISTSMRPLKLATSMGFASGDTEPETLIDDNQVRLIHDSQTGQFRLSSQVHPEGTLMRVVMIGSDGGQVWQRFVLLWDKFRDQVMGRCEAPKPGDQQDPESRKHNSIICLPVSADQLAEQDAVALEQSWTWSKANQATSVDAWKKFASELRQNSNVEAIKAVAERIG
jgi:hypothetical protein